MNRRKKATSPCLEPATYNQKSPLKSCSFTTRPSTQATAAAKFAKLSWRSIIVLRIFLYLKKKEKNLLPFPVESQQMKRTVFFGKLPVSWQNFHFVSWESPFTI